MHWIREGAALCFVLCCALQDLQRRSISVRFLGAAALLLAGIGIAFPVQGRTLPELALALLAGGLLLLGAILLPGQIGAGDGLVFLLLGPVLCARQVWMALLLALLGQGVLSAGGLLMRRLSKESRVPFVPAAAAGVLLAVLWRR